MVREDLGKIVRDEWVAWAREQTDATDHPSWLLPWEELAERDREVDRRIGVAVYMTARREVDEARTACINEIAKNGKLTELVERAVLSLHRAGLHVSAKDIDDELGRIA